MAKKTSKSSAGKSTKSNAEKSHSKRRNRRELKKAIWLVVGALVLALGSAAAISAYKKNWAEAHDLSVIGQGIPAIIQVHDPKCPKCKKLMENTKVALRDYDDKFVFKIADITTGAGRSLQRDHDARIISLLIFNGRGELKRRISGVKDPDVLDIEFDDFLKRYVR
ncbi:MAG: thioredoxin family protein [Acidiferrobacterales bacterium]|nr:thioredoxin family protein [Acidiferrobacterales bacterium]